MTSEVHQIFALKSAGVSEKGKGKSSCRNILIIILIIMGDRISSHVPLLIPLTLKL